jgi:hypothetical protein
VILVTGGHFDSRTASTTCCGSASSALRVRARSRGCICHAVRADCQNPIRLFVFEPSPLYCALLFDPEGDNIELG